MQYLKKPKMVLFDVGGTLFCDGPCDPVAGFEALRLVAQNPEITSGEELAKLWDIFLRETDDLKSQSGIKLDIPLSAVIKYATMKCGLRFNIPIAEQEEIFDRFNSSRQVIDGVHRLLTELESKKIRTAVISNNMMSGESLAIALNRWIPDNKFEFCLTSADLLFTKPSSEIFSAATGLAGLEPRDCWYCGDGIVPDVDGALNCGITPVLLDQNGEKPREFRENHNRAPYLAINNWNILGELIDSI